MRWLIIVLALGATTAADAKAALDDFDHPLGKHWIVSRPSRVRIIDSRDPAHGSVMQLQPDGDDVYALIRETAGWAGGAIEGDMRFPPSEDSYLGVIYDFRATQQRTDFGVIYIKGNESYAQANPHYDFNVSRTLYPEYRVVLGGAAAIRVGEWQHFKLEVLGRRAHLYVGDMSVPQMTFSLFNGDRGALGLQPRSVGGDVWVDNIRWHPLTALSYSGPDRPEIHSTPEQLLTSWSAAGPCTHTADNLARHPGNDEQWRPFANDVRGAILTAAVNAFHGDRTVAYFRTQISTATARRATLVLSTADDLALWVNGRFSWFVPRAPASWFDFLTNAQHKGQRIPIDLVRGRNDIVVRVRGGSYATGAFFAAVDDLRTAEELVRAGEYARAAQAWSERLTTMAAADRDRAVVENRVALYRSLADVPPMRATFDGSDKTVQLTRNPLGSWNVRARAGDHDVDWLFDTGANISTMTQSEANALGLKIRDAGASVLGSTGAKNALQLAVVPELRIGPARVTNVVFLILDDEALHASAAGYQIRGIVGMPVLHALRHFTLDAAGTLRIHPVRWTQGTPNVTLDGWSPLVDVMHRGHRLRLLIDTGANVTSFYPTARAALSAAETASLTRKHERSGGVGGLVSRETDLIPTIALQIGNETVVLHNVSLLPEAPANDDLPDGVLGMDALGGGFTLNFAETGDSACLTLTRPR